MLQLILATIAVLGIAIYFAMKRRMNKRLAVINETYKGPAFEGSFRYGGVGAWIRQNWFTRIFTAVCAVGLGMLVLFAIGGDPLTRLGVIVIGTDMFSLVILGISWIQARKQIAELQASESPAQRAARIRNQGGMEN